MTAPTDVLARREMPKSPVPPFHHSSTRAALAAHYAAPPPPFLLRPVYFALLRHSAGFEASFINLPRWTVKTGGKMNAATEMLFALGRTYYGRPVVDFQLYYSHIMRLQF